MIRCNLRKKAFGAFKRCFSLPKYCKTFDSLQYLFHGNLRLLSSRFKVYIQRPLNRCVLKSFKIKKKTITNEDVMFKWLFDLFFSPDTRKPKNFQSYESSSRQTVLKKNRPFVCNVQLCQTQRYYRLGSCSCFQKESVDATVLLVMS